jgi:hypothetical protein
MPRLMKWKSKIFMDGKYFVIGYFDEFDDAVKARKQAVIVLSPSMNLILFSGKEPLT